MKVLALDIETSPAIAHVWGLYNVNVGLNQLVEPSRMICFAARWIDEPEGVFYSERQHGHRPMVAAAWSLLTAADAVMTYNGDRFDLPHLNREFLNAGLLPPSPYKSIDLLKTVRKVFKFQSGKLAYVTKALGLEGKLETGGHELWKACLEGDPEAWGRMEKYNRRDVDELLTLYERLQPWIRNHPSYAAETGEQVCPRCGADDLRKEGYAYTGQAKRQRFQCRKCGSWSQGTKSISLVSIREAAA